VTGALIASNILLWVVVLGLLALVFALMRQVGVLHERIAPAGALVGATGPAVGAPAPILDLETWTGDRFRLADPASETPRASTLLLFVSPTCPVCKTLLPFLDSLRRSESDAQRPLRIVLASDGPRAEHEAFVAEHSLANETYVLSRELGLAYAVEKLPTAYLIDTEGILRAKGLVNCSEHLESLFEARERGVASIQEFMTASEPTSDSISNPISNAISNPSSNDTWKQASGKTKGGNRHVA